MADKKSTTPSGAARIAVRALREIIENEVAKGYSIKAIFERHKERIPVSYERFRVHVNREITKTARTFDGNTQGVLAAPKSPSAHPIVPATQTVPSPPMPKAARSNETSKFPT